MSAGTARAVERLAASIADGTAIDWSAAGSEGGPDEQRLIRHLRLIGTVAQVYRSLPPDPEADGEEDLLAAPEPAGPRWGRLILLDRIGQGTSADVFRAWDVDLQREVALKLLRVDGVTADAAANARMLQEARRIARVGHPHVVHVYGAERHEERIGLWMELVRGRSLDDIVRTDGPLSADAAVRIGADLCGAVAAVHAAGLLHRDIKAQNVIREDSAIADAGRIVLMDFGAGEEIGAVRARVAGTPLYLAPEILAGGAASAASDVYALGVLLCYLTTGAFPVQAASIEELRAAHRAGDRRAIRALNPKVPAPLAAVIDRAIAPDPAARYDGPAAMEADLRRVARGEPIAGRRATVRRGWLAGLASAAAIALLVGTVARSRTDLLGTTNDVASLAVLPLTADASDTQATRLADGLTEELIATLGQLQDVRVTAHTSVRRFKASPAPVRAAADQLGVENVLEGRVSVDEGVAGGPRRVRVNARLLEAATGASLWAGSLERPLGDLAQLQSDLARAIARRLHASLSASESTRLQVRHATNPEAEQAYIEGRAHIGQFAARAGLALASFNRAIALDPQHARARAGAARSYIALGFDRAISNAEARASALAEATRALDIDANLADAHGVIADLRFFYDWDFAAAERAYQTALDLEPSASYVRSQYAQYLAAMGRLDEARDQIAESVARDPLSASAKLTQALILYYGRDYDAALSAAREAESLDPTLPTTHFLRGRILEARGELAAALGSTERAIETSANVATGWRVQALRLLALSGDVARARTGMASLNGTGTAEYLRASAHEAYLRLATGETEAAIAILRRAVELRDPSVLWIDVDPRLDSIRQRPDFLALRQRIGLR